MLCYQEFLKNGKYTDLMLKGLDKDGWICTVPCHKIIMAASFGERFLKFICQPNNYLSAGNSTLKALVDFAYNFPVNVSNENLSELLKFSSSYFHQDFAKILGSYLLKNITIENALETFQLAQEGIPHERDSLQLIKAFIVKKRFLKLNQISSGFKNVPLPIMRELVKDDHLGISEEELFTLITQWGFERESLFYDVRFSFIEEKFFKANVQTNKSRTLKKAMNASRHMRQGPRIPNEFVFAMGGWADRKLGVSDGPTNLIDKFGNEKFDWQAIRKMPRPRAYHGLEVVDQTVYVFGGFNRDTSPLGQNRAVYLNDLMAFDLNKQTWKAMDEMLEPRCYIAATVLNGCIYAMGGFNGEGRLRSVERYDPKVNLWSFVAEMHHVRSDAACVAFQGRIFIIGGFDGEIIHRSVEIYDPRNNTWTFGPELNIRRSGVRAVVYNDKLYVVGGYNGLQRQKTMEVFDPSTSNFFVHLNYQMNTGRSNFAMSVLDDKILVMGGYDGTGVSKECESFDERTRTWTKTKPLTRARSALEAVTLDHFSLDYQKFV